MRTAEEYGAEALHARHLDAPYRPGRRPRSWVRVPLRRSGLVVVGGWTPADPQRPDRVGALLLGVPDPEPDRGLRYVGRVGIGAGEEQREVAAQLARLRRAGLAVRRAAARRPSPATRSGPSPAWSGGSSSPTGRRTGGCGSPRGAGSSPRAGGRRAAAAAARLDRRPAGSGRRCDAVAGRPPPGEPDRRPLPEAAPDIGAAAVRGDRGPAARAALRLQRPEHHRGPDAHRPRPGP